METTQVVLTPEQVERRFPNALMAEQNKIIVNFARQHGLKIAVTFYDAIWGRTVVKIQEVA